MKYKMLLSMSLLTLCITLSSASAFAEGKIAVIDFEKALFNTDIIQNKVKEMQADPSYKKDVADIQAIQSEGKKLVEKLKKEEMTMSVAQKQQADTQLKIKQQDIEHIAKKLKSTEESILQPMMVEMNNKATQIVKELIATEGIGLLLDASAQTHTVLHADTSFDITAKVTEKLNKLNAKK